MKTLIAVILALGIGFAGAYVVVTNQKNAELAKLRAQPPAPVQPASTASGQKVIVKTVSTAPVEESPMDILNDLLNINLSSGGGKNAALRLVVFKLETLVQRGVAAVPAIRSFLGKNVDVDYGQQDSQNSRDDNGNANTNNARRGRFNRGGFDNFRSERRARDIRSLQTDWIAPPSLRLGLVGVLKEIGGADAQQALAEMLASTARGVEVAYLTVVLEDMVPGQYRDVAIKAAKDLLMNPIAMNNPDRLDQLSKAYLYGVLEFYKDSSFAENAEQMLIGPDGRVDQDAMDYLSTVMGEQSVSALYAAYNNPSLSNQFDKMQLGRDILNYVGQSPEANQLFTQTLNNQDLDSRMKAMVVAGLAGGGFGPFRSDAPTDPQTINVRIGLLTSLESQYGNDPTISQAIAMTKQALQGGTSVDMRQLFGRGRGRGNRGGGNNNQNNQ